MNQQQNSISIASSAMLVELSISGWSARKLDKKASAQVDITNSTKTKAGNYNKNLLAGTGFLDTITKYAANSRAWHLSQTLPWSDNGLRLLPMGRFLEYKKQLYDLEANYMALVDKFVIAYPNLVSAAAFQLGDLFDRTEYPEVESIPSKFKFKANYLPVPMAGDFRVDIGEEAKAELIASCEGIYNERLDNAMKSAWTRLHSCLVRVSDRLADADEQGNPKRIYDTLVEEAVGLVDLLKHFNLTNDPTMEQARLGLSDAIKHHDADDFRGDAYLREQVKTKVDAMLSKFNF
jgi:hypothetical protein